MQVEIIHVDWVCADCGEDRDYYVDVAQLPVVNSGAMPDALPEVVLRCPECGTDWTSFMLFLEQGACGESGTLKVLW